MKPFELAGSPSVKPKDFVLRWAKGAFPAFSCVSLLRVVPAQLKKRSRKEAITAAHAFREGRCVAAPQRGAELQLQAQKPLTHVKPRGHRSSLSFPKFLNPEKKNQSSGLRGTLPASRESVANSGMGLVWAHLDHEVRRAASPEAVFAQKRVICLGDFYQRAQVLFNLQLPRAAIKEGGEGWAERGQSY